MLLGVTGSVATIKLEELASKLAPIANLKIVATQSARNFFEAERRWASAAIGESTPGVTNYQQSFLFPRLL